MSSSAKAAAVLVLVLLALLVLSIWGIQGPGNAGASNQQEPSARSTGQISQPSHDLKDDRQKDPVEPKSSEKPSLSLGSPACPPSVDCSERERAIKKQSNAERTARSPD